MHTLRLRINDKIYDKLIWLLSKFDKSELEVISEDSEFLSTKKYLTKELEEIKSGQAKFMSLDELNDTIDQTISKYENRR